MDQKIGHSYIPLNSDRTPTDIRRLRVLNLGIKEINAKRSISDAIPAEITANIVTACNHSI